MKTNTAQELADFGVIGLAVMGRNLAPNIDDHGFSVAVWNLETEVTDAFVAVRERASSSWRSRSDASTGWLAGARAAAPHHDDDQGRPAVDSVLDGPRAAARAGRRRHRRRQTLVREHAPPRSSDRAAKGIHFVGMGVSGGEEGARRGPSLMPGGDGTAWEPLAPVLEAIAAKTDSGPCVTHFGPDGAGHFVKMVHNGIEYGDMQLIAEAYDLLARAGWASTRRASATSSREWNQRPARVVPHRDHRQGAGASRTRETGQLAGRPRCSTRPARRAPGKWTAQVALDLGVPIPTIAAALDARVLSSMKDERVRGAARILAAADRGRCRRRARASSIGDVHDALYAAKICSYAQGMHAHPRGLERVQAGTSTSGEIARIWKGGCIIRARFLDSIMQRATSATATCRTCCSTRTFAKRARRARRRAGAGSSRCAQARGIPVPAHVARASPTSTATARRALPQNLTQAQRDAFGAHTYERTDKPERGLRAHRLARLSAEVK